MRWARFMVLGVGVLLLGWPAWAGTGKILKVLPHLLDSQGRHAVSPSLYDRDAYQAYLRENPEACHGLRFDVNWKGKRVPKEGFRLRVELVTSKTNPSEPVVLEETVKPGWLGRRWSKLTLQGAAYQEAGELVAWRVSLWEGQTRLDSEQSFLW